MKEKTGRAIDRSECAKPAEKPFNQVEQMEKEIEYLKDQLDRTKEECLDLYRRLYGQDVPRRY